MRFSITGDVHGQKPEIKIQNFDAIISPGDLCPSDIKRRYAFKAIDMRIKDPSSNVEWYDIMGKGKARKLVKDSINVGRGILEFLDSYGVPVYVVPGNGDFPPKNIGWDYLKKNHYKDMLRGIKNIVDVQNRIVDIGEYQIIGYGISSGPEYPQDKEEIARLGKKDMKIKKKEYNRTYDKISSLFEKADKPVIFLSHNVPFNTPIDVIVNKDSPRNGMHYGSLIAREIIEKYQPLICIGGHMHEHFGGCNIGKTKCMNTGFGSKVETLLELEKGRIKKLEFYKWK